jgi:hypothetical protein
LHDPAVPPEQLMQVREVVMPGSPRMITLPAHISTSDIQATLTSR